MKDLIKIISASLFLVALFPLLLFSVTLLIIFDQSSPFFFQTRIGYQKKEFVIYKLRSMKNNKVTFIGNVLRKTGIDELPQLLNIIKGDLNFVGPRPLTQNDITRLNWETKFHQFRWQTKPGLTGLAQLSPVCNKRISLFWDKYYIENQSTILNFRIIVGSVLIPILGKNRVKNMLKSKS